VIAAAVLAANPSPIGVENCWSAWLSSERRVWEGTSAANLASMVRNADREAARSRMAGPNFRKNRICAASQASYAVFQVQAPSASEPLKAAIIAVRSACASIAWPRSRSASSNLAAASARPSLDCKGAGAADGAAAIAAVTKFEFMRDIQESEDGRSRGALSRPRPAQTRPGRPFPLRRGRLACAWGSRRRHEKSPGAMAGLEGGKVRGGRSRPARVNHSAATACD
jgi:hypothetical protein